MSEGGGCWRSSGGQTARAIELDLAGRRRGEPQLARAYEAALAVACGRGVHGGAERRLWRAGLAVAGVVERLARDQAAAGGELHYHNRHHFVDATLAMGWLCGASRGMGELNVRDAATGVTAMVGHDLGHDGDSALDGRLEAFAAAAVDGIATRVGVVAEDRVRLVEVIRATRQDLWAENAAQALRPGKAGWGKAGREKAGRGKAGWGKAGRGGAGLAMLRLLANEADAFASLMPGLGAVLGRALTAERAARGDPSAAVVGSHAGRLGFLLGFQKFSPAARRLGLAAARDRQVAAYTRIGRAQGAGRAAGALALDRLPEAEAAARYRLAWVAVGIQGSAPDPLGAVPAGPRHTR